MSEALIWEGVLRAEPATRAAWAEFMCGGGAAFFLTNTTPGIAIVANGPIVSRRRAAEHIVAALTSVAPPDAKDEVIAELQAQIALLRARCEALEANPMLVVKPPGQMRDEAIAAGLAADGDGPTPLPRRTPIAAGDLTQQVAAVCAEMPGVSRAIELIPERSSPSRRLHLVAPARGEDAQAGFDISDNPHLGCDP